MATDHDGALDCTPGAGDGERAPAAAPLHCDPTSTGSLKSPIIAAFSRPPRAISIRLELSCSSAAQHSAMPPAQANCATRQQEIAAGKVGRQRQAGGSGSG